MSIERFKSDEYEVEDIHIHPFKYSYDLQHQELIGLVKNKRRRKIRIEIQNYDSDEFVAITPFTSMPIVPYTFIGPSEKGEYSNIFVKIVDEHLNTLILDNFGQPLKIESFPNTHTVFRLDSYPSLHYIKNFRQNSIRVKGYVLRSVIFNDPGADQEVNEIFYQIDDQEIHNISVTDNDFAKTIPINSLELNQYHMITFWPPPYRPNEYQIRSYVFKYISTPIFNYTLAKDSFHSNEKFMMKYNLAGGFDDRMFNILYKFGSEEKFINYDKVFISEDPNFVSIKFPPDLTFGSQNITFQFSNDNTKEYDETTIVFKYLESHTYPINHDSHVSLCVASASIFALAKFSRFRR